MSIRELDYEAVRAMIPNRDPEGHKGTFGKLLLLCGSQGYTGAPWFAAMGALRVGAGLVFLGVPRSIYQIEAVKLNEPVIFPLPDEDGMLAEQALLQILPRLSQVDALLIGCGLGQSQGTLAVLNSVLEQASCPVVLDADGINLLSQHRDILRRRAGPTILTPHDGEFLRLGGSLGQDRMASAQALARELGAIVVLKGHRTCITDGSRSYRNLTGNSGMAVGGSGDLLAGMITGLLGQGMDPLEAAACGVWLHGAAGDEAARELGEYAMLPTDLLNTLPRLLK